MGGQRKLIVPPMLAYGKKGIGEVPPDATLEFEVRLPYHLKQELCAATQAFSVRYCNLN